MKRKHIFFIGPLRCGTTWLFEMFKKNSNCSYIEGKEIYFFEKKFTFALNAYLSNFVHRNNFYIDISPTYLRSPDVAQKIKENFKAPRINIILKTTSEIAFSQFLYLRKNGFRIDSFTEFILNDKFKDIRDSLKYSKNLPVWFSLYDRDDLNFYDFDRFKQNNINYFANICNDIGLTYNKNIENVGIINDSNGMPIFSDLYRCMVQIGRFSANFLPKNKIRYFRTYFFDRIFMIKNKKYDFSESEKKLALEYYRDDDKYVHKLRSQLNDRFNI